MRINARLSILRPTACAALQPRGTHPAPVTGVATALCGARGQPAEGELDMPGYPAQHESGAVLSDGSVIHLRPIRPDDATRLLDLHHRLSPRSLYHRFFTIPRPDPVHAQYLAEVDYIKSSTRGECEGAQEIIMTSKRVSIGACPAERTLAYV